MKNNTENVSENNLNTSSTTTTTTTTSTTTSTTSNLGNVTAIGWFYESEYETMRKIIKKILYRRIDEFISRQQQILNASKQTEENNSIVITKPKHLAYEGKLLIFIFIYIIDLFI